MTPTYIYTTTTGSPHDHAAYIPQAQSFVPSATAQTGYPYASSSMPSLPPLPLYSVPLPAYRMGLQHKNQLGTAAWPTAATAESPTMAITIPQNNRSAPTATNATSGRSSRNGGDGRGSERDGERTPPSGGSHAAKESKKKIHPCWMCHKSFDRPSTLKKHLLVHTGEKAFACESCGRRFGVLSNLNRHAKTCRAAHATTTTTTTTSTGTGAPAGNPSRASGSASPSHSQATSATSPPASSSPEANAGTPPASDAVTSAATTTAVNRRPARKRKATDEETQSPESATTAPEGRAPRTRKRARRAPSPAVWIPDSLRTFDLTPMTKGTPVPLPPVRPFQDSHNMEERDSFDENASTSPYHPHGWKGRLPGPGLLGNNVANRSGGQILIF